MTIAIITSITITKLIINTLISSFFDKTILLCSKIYNKLTKTIKRIPIKITITLNNSININKFTNANKMGKAIKIAKFDFLNLFIIT